MRTRKRIGDILTQMGLVSKEDVEKGLREQEHHRNDKKIGEILLEIGLLKEDDLIRALALQYQLPFMKKLPDEPSLELVRMIPFDFMQRHQTVPIELEHCGRLKVATTNPLSLLFVDSLKVGLQRDIHIVGTSPAELARLLLYFDRARSYFSDSGRQVEGPGTDETKSALIQMVTYLFNEALKQKASDIHLETCRDEFVVRYRVDGLLRDNPAPPKDLSPQIVSRIKVMAGLDLAEKHLPQDGRIQFDSESGRVDFRVSILPSLHGESIVLRILKRESVKHGLEELGMSESSLEIFRSLISHPHGMIFVTGPTGSGKTTTLYAALQMLNDASHKIITVEDPVEYELDGINQVQVKPAIGLGFSQSLRAMLRQSPSIILVGEIRDQETAQIAVQAALTGHLVFSTLHTNDALSVVPRLIDLGIKPYLVSAATQGVIAQRLVRKICDNCREEISHDPTFDAYLRRHNLHIAHHSLYRGKGCSDCRGTGFRGRIAIFEMFSLDDDFRTALVGGKGNINELRTLAQKKGMKGLFEDGLEKVMNGLTSLEEVLRVVEASDSDDESV